MELRIPDFGLVVLIGAAGSGKTTFAARHFKQSETLSSDHYRTVVGDDDRGPETTKAAFDVIEAIAAKRLAARRLTVIDATNVQPDDRKRYVRLARSAHAPVSAIVLDLPEAECQRQNAARGADARPPHVVRRQARSMRRHRKALSREGYRRRLRLQSAAEAASAEVVRVPLGCDRRNAGGPFDIIGDVHGCAAELEALLEKLGYAVTRTDTDGGPHYDVRPPEGRTLVFLGDLNDRGPASAATLALAMDAVAAGRALAMPGNHEAKLAKALAGRNVEPTHGLAETLEQLASAGEAFKTRVSEFIDALPSHVVLDRGRLIAAHAGMKEHLQNRTSNEVREFGLYGETTGETDDEGLPVRLDWPREYRGKAAVVYGHTPVREPEWVNNTLCIDTGCVFGGRLSALRWPEREIVSVDAGREYWPAPKALAAPPEALSGQQASDALLDVEDVRTPMRLQTRLAGSVSIRPEYGAAALDTMSRFAVDPRWLIYLPPTMAPCEAAAAGDLLEHPREAFGYFRARKVRRVMCQDKHMGSRAVIVVCRDDKAAHDRFGIESKHAGIIYTRTGRRFFDDAKVEREVLDRVRAGFDEAGLWEELQTGWACLDAEIMPWSAKGGGLIRDQYAPVGVAGRMGLAAARAALGKAAERNPEIGSLAARFEERERMAALYDAAYRRYNWSTNGVEGLKIAPFHLLATEGAVHDDKTHEWHMQTLGRLTAAGGILSATEHLTVDVEDEEAVGAATLWWTERTGRGAEGMVVKPETFVAHTERGIAAPAIKCRGREYLRIIYGPEYTTPTQLEQLRKRSTRGKMALATREFALGMHALHQFVERVPLRNVHRAVFAVLALESEPTDPRL